MSTSFYGMEDILFLTAPMFLTQSVKRSLFQLPHYSLILVIKIEKGKEKDVQHASLSHLLLFFRTMLIQEQ